jgi:hypothetical protein
LPKRTITFNKLLTEAIDSAFSTLGDSAKQSIYFHLQDKFKIARSDIPKRPKEFEAGLEKIFGSGSKFLEILIMKKLYEKTGQPLEWDENTELAFVDYVAAAKRNYSKKNK